MKIDSPRPRPNPPAIAPSGSARPPFGFALVEIVIAMGVVTFTLVAIIGMLSVGMKSSRESTEDTLIANMATAVLNNLRTTNSYSNLTLPASNEVYFDSMGRWDTNGSVFGASNSKSLYRCTYVLDNTNATTGGTNLIMARLIFTWPVQAAKAPNTNILHATLTPY